jgi:glutamate/tyrosine decarboxylase-like PLP-dependent enzyme
MAARLSREPGVEVVNDVELNQVIVRFGSGLAPADRDRLTTAVIDRLRATGACLLGGARWRDGWVMRVSIIGWTTDEPTIDASCHAIVAAWREVRPDA